MHTGGNVPEGVARAVVMLEYTHRSVSRCQQIV